MACCHAVAWSARTQGAEAAELLGRSILSLAYLVPTVCVAASAAVSLQPLVAGNAISFLFASRGRRPLCLLACFGSGWFWRSCANVVWFHGQSFLCEMGWHALTGCNVAHVPWSASCPSRAPAVTCQSLMEMSPKSAADMG